MTEKQRPAGKGVGRCPSPLPHGACGCGCTCVKCGHPLHSAIHMHVSGEQIGDPPYGHEFEPHTAYGREMFNVAVRAPDGEQHD